MVIAKGANEPLNHHFQMNILKATVATAAVITCCLGNEMPAQALSDEKRQILIRGIQNITDDWEDHYRRQYPPIRRCHHNILDGYGSTTCY